MQKELNIGSNRGRPRLWIEGKFLLASNWNCGDRWNVDPQPNRLVLSKDAEGKRKVAGTAQRPIIDMVGKVIEDAFDCNAVSRVIIVATANQIVISEANLK